MTYQYGATSMEEENQIRGQRIAVALARHTGKGSRFTDEELDLVIAGLYRLCNEGERGACRLATELDEMLKAWVALD